MPSTGSYLHSRYNQRSCSVIPRPYFTGSSHYEFKPPAQTRQRSVFAFYRTSVVISRFTTDPGRCVFYNANVYKNKHRKYQNIEKWDCHILPYWMSPVWQGRVPVPDQGQPSHSSSLICLPLIFFNLPQLAKQHLSERCRPHRSIWLVTALPLFY